MTRQSEAATLPGGGGDGNADTVVRDYTYSTPGSGGCQIDAALRYAARGWAVFPARPRGKEPLTPRGFHDATTNPAAIRAWWRRWPDANVAIATGDKSGLLVVDVDAHGALDGAEALNALERRFGPLPETVCAVSGGGGMHFYFRCPPGARSGKLVDGVDVKAEGGYVIAPPSVHPSGEEYVWDLAHHPDDTPLADPPAWLLDLLAKRAPAAPPLPETVKEGKRNITLASLAGSMRRRGASESAILAALLEENARRCDPTLPEDEVRNIARSIARYEPQTYLPLKGGAVVGRLHEVSAAEIRAAGVAGDDTLEYLDFLGLEGYIVRGWAHLVAGYPKAGKTELLTRLIQRWTERVLYFTEEPRSIWSARLARLPGEWGHVTIVFALGAEPDHILSRIQQGSETVVVIDTVRNLLNIKDETDNSEVARVLNPFIATCRDKNKTLLMAHHIRKGGGEYGEGITGGHAFLGVVDIALEVSRDSNNDLRRKVRGWGRVIMIPELLYQQEPDGAFRPLGSPSQVMLEGVKERLLDVLNNTWQSRKEILDALDDPKPPREQVRLALEALMAAGKVERDPATQRSGVTYRYRLCADQPTYHQPTYSGRLGLDEPLGDHCCICGGELWAYDPDGRPLCQQHALEAGIVEVA